MSSEARAGALTAWPGSARCSRNEPRQVTGHPPPPPQPRSAFPAMAWPSLATARHASDDISRDQLELLKAKFDVLQGERKVRARRVVPAPVPARRSGPL